MCLNKNCNAKCCYAPPIPKNHLIQYADKMVRSVVETEYLGDSPFGKDNVIPKTENNKCPFLKEDNKCNIYDQRPEICKAFGVTIECKLDYHE